MHTFSTRLRAFVFVLVSFSVTAFAADGDVLVLAGGTVYPSPSGGALAELVVLIFVEHD
jgi:hypothetical protein